ncbi:MAG: hypothetical protein EXX96DRAFT_569682 [Benjaminiella poitrasii]|nr:MAG: hypothetical protein EXX96DRAFT_569682 [Benjaminiella poitrasii]
MTSLKRKLGDICNSCNSRIETFKINLDCEIIMCSNLKCNTPFNLPHSDFLYNVSFDKDKWYIDMDREQAPFVLPLNLPHILGLSKTDMDSTNPPKKAMPILDNLPAKPEKTTLKKKEKATKPLEKAKTVPIMLTPNPHKIDVPTNTPQRSNTEETIISSSSAVTTTQLDLDNLPSLTDFLASPVSIEHPFDITKDIDFIDAVDATGKALMPDHNDIINNSANSTTSSMNVTNQATAAHFDPVITQLLDQFSDITQNTPKPVATSSFIPPPSSLPLGLALPPLSAAKKVIMPPLPQGNNYSISELEKFLNDI